MTPFLVPRLKRWVLACAALGLLFPATANAQFPTVVSLGNNGAPTDRTKGPIEHDNRNAISYADCKEGDVLTYQVSMSNVGGGELQVWVAGAGNNCADSTARNNTTNRVCWLVHTRPAANATFLPIELNSQAIISGNTMQSTVVTPSLQECDESTYGSTNPQQLTLHFMVIDAAGTAVSNDATATVEADLIGPPAPTNIKAGIGEERLVLSWDQAAAADRSGHRFYCAPVQTTMQGDGGIDLDSGALDGAIDPDAGMGGTPNDAGPTDGGGGAGGTTATDSGTDAGGGGNSNCPTPALVSGQRPDEQYRCGSVGPNNVEGEASGLQNNVLYAVGIAARDRLENAGPLSQVVCGTPQEVDDFYEVYKRAGGQGGGGFCAFGAQPASGAGLLFGIAALARWLRRRRR